MKKGYRIIIPEHTKNDFENVLIRLGLIPGFISTQDYENRHHYNLALTDQELVYIKLSCVYNYIISINGNLTLALSQFIEIVAP